VPAGQAVDTKTGNAILSIKFQQGLLWGPEPGIHGVKSVSNLLRHLTMITSAGWKNYITQNSYNAC